MSEEFLNASRHLAEVDPIIHAPARLGIMAALFVVKAADFVFLVRQTGLTRGNLSAHLSKLEAAGYITVEKKFVKRVPRTLLSLTEQGREAFQTYRKQVQQALDELPES
ncbi:transcriptional regulator [bacterium]|nr:transcriptional regulator [bacterium]